jgi:hypothetical protein
MAMLIERNQLGSWGGAKGPSTPPQVGVRARLHRPLTPTQSVKHALG